MKKSHFQRTFNYHILFIILGSLSFILGLLCHLLITVRSSNPKLVTDFQSILFTYEDYFISLAFMFIIIAILLIGFELIQRQKTDSLWNYFKSGYQTIQLRLFLKQNEKTESVLSIDNQTKTTRFNPTLKSFNHAVAKCTVDIRNESISVFIKIPRSQQAQKLLKDMDRHIKEEISNKNPEYYFSSPNREKNNLWYIGTKR